MTPSDAYRASPNPLSSSSSAKPREFAEPGPPAPGWLTLATSLEASQLSTAPINIGLHLARMPRPSATHQTEQRVQRLLVELLRPLDSGEMTVAKLATEAGLGHETVRRLWRNPTGALRYGPGFFIVAALAAATNVSLDDLVMKVRA